MLLIIPIIPAALALLGTAKFVIITIGGLIVASAVLKASKSVVDLVKDGKVGLEAKKVIKKISDYDEQIADIVMEKKLRFDNAIFTDEIEKIKKYLEKVEIKKKDIERIKRGKWNFKNYVIKIIVKK